MCQMSGGADTGNCLSSTIRVFYFSIYFMYSSTKYSINIHVFFNLFHVFYQIFHMHGGLCHVFYQIFLMGGNWDLVWMVSKQGHREQKQAKARQIIKQDNGIPTRSAFLVWSTLHSSQATNLI